jgi:carboxyl-terminal processing protease
MAYCTVMPEKPGWDVRIMALGAALFLAAGFFLGTGSAQLVPWASKAVADEGLADADLKPLYKAWELLDDNFAPASTTATSTLSSEEKVWGMIAGLAASYGDPYTEFLPPQKKEVFEASVEGNFGGVGMEVGVRNGGLAVIAPLKNTPASRAGIKAGDAILVVDGENTAQMSVEEAVGKIRGEVGTEVTILFSRDGESFERVMTRERIELPTVDTKLRSDGVFVINVYMFNAQAPNKFRDALRQFADSGADKMIVDLRGNPGGYLEVAVDMASWFLPVGATVVVQDYAEEGQADEVFRSRGYNVFTDNLKLAILIDEGSASASEIFAGALRDHRKATLVGQKSFGKGSVQQLFDVTPDAALKITVARWLTPNGVSISHEGVHPDIEVEVTPEDVEAARDSQLERAARFLITGN